MKKKSYSTPHMTIVALHRQRMLISVTSVSGNADLKWGSSDYEDEIR